MLDRRWKRIVLALRVHAVAVNTTLACVLGAVVSTWLAARVFHNSPDLSELLLAAILPLGIVGGVASLVSIGSLTIYATVPADSGARPSAIVAALAAVLQPVAAAAGAVLALLAPDLAAAEALLFSLAEPVLVLLGLYAMARSLKTVADYIRADAVYSRASALSTGIGLLIAFLIVMGVLSRLWLSLLVVAAFATTVFAIMIAVTYARLTFQAAFAVAECTVD